MILTITLNPSVDISYQLIDLKLNKSNRSTLTNKTAGGKGLNVTRVLNCINIPIRATGFLGGTNGLFIQKELDQMKIQHDFVSIAGNSRNCIAILHDTNQTEILEEGPSVLQSEYEHFLRKMEHLFPVADVIVASGSLPKGVPYSFYKKLADTAHYFQKPFLLDTSGESLEKALESQPTFIKPNLSEFEALMGKAFETEDEIVKALKTNPFQVPYVMVSLGEKGALVKQGKQFYKVSIPTVETINPVGSGDAAVAGFAAGLFKGLKNEELFSYSAVMGLLNAMELKTGFVNPLLVTQYMKEIRVEAL